VDKDVRVGVRARRVVAVWLLGQKRKAINGQPQTRAFPLRVISGLF
jgi:hypothetical protein